MTRDYYTGIKNNGLFNINRKNTEDKMLDKKTAHKIGFIEFPKLYYIKHSIKITLIMYFLIKHSKIVMFRQLYSV